MCATLVASSNEAHVSPTFVVAPKRRRDQNTTSISVLKIDTIQAVRIQKLTHVTLHLNVN